MWASVLKTASPVVRKQLLPVQYCACLKSTVAVPEIIEVDNAKSFKDMPGPRGRYSIPKIGPAFFMKPLGQYTGHTFHKLLDSLHDKYGPTFRMELFGPSVVTANPDAIESLFRNEGKLPQRLEINIIATYADRNNKAKGMAAINGHEWRQLRSATQKHVLKVDSASIYVKQQVAVTNDLITRIAKKTYTPEEFRCELFQYATESIGVVCFNKRLGCLEPDDKPLTEEIVRYLDAIQKFFHLISLDVGPPLYKFLPTKLYREFERVANDAYGYGREQIDEVLAKAVRQIEDGTFDPKEPNLILQLQATPNTTVESVNAILLDLLTGGTDSTAKTMELNLLNLALNPDKQQKLYEEILDVIGPKGNEMEAHHMSKMPYFRACMKESFRKYFPTSFGTLRALPHDAVIDGYLIPQGTYVMNNSRRVCLDPEYFESPEKYEPERWLRDGKTTLREKEIPAFALLPFGFGLRNCLGRRFAEQELWLGVTKIVQNFNVTVPDKHYEAFYTTFCQAKEPIDFTFTPR